MSDSILIIEDNIKLLRLMKKHFHTSGYDVHTSTSLEGTKRIITSRKISIIILDLMLNGESGLDGIDGFLELDPLLHIIVITGFASIDTAVEAMRKGAYDYIQKPVEIDHLQKTIENALRFRALKKENSQLRRQLITTNYYINSRSETTQAIFDNALKLGRTELPILLLGECGTGKEVIADYIHANSLRSDKPMVKVNSSAFPDGLLENELFGHEKDSFTGASTTYKGLFEQADKGTLFLDEIGDMGLSSQSKILRTLQNKEIRRIGGSGTINVDVRLIAATNMNISALIEEKRFRQDLYYRINAAIIRLPLLRERKEDIPFLAEHFIRGKANAENLEGMISEEVMDIFTKYHWPGNIRELQNVIEYGLALSNGATILSIHLPPYFQDEGINPPTEQGKRGHLDRNRIEQALKKCRYNKKRTAEILCISRKTLYEKMRKYDIAY